MPLGTGESGLVLPDTLTAAVKLGAEEISVTDSVYGSDGTDEGITEIPVPVTWTSQPEYDGNIAGVYTFTAEIPDFALTAAPPIITVTVYEGEAKGIITAFEELEEDVRWQNTWEPMLPEKVKGIVEGRAMDISVTWEADHEYNADSPEPGLYVFTAEIGGDYTLADGVEVLRIAVYIPETTGSATENDHLVITTANQLAEIADLVNRGRLESFIFNDSSATVYLELENDIDLSADGTGNDWTPIGTEDNPFKGNFDGNNKSINGLKINSSGKDYLGLFGYINGGSVKNIAVTNVDIYGKDYVGAVAGYVNNSAIESCYSTGSITGQGYVGGIAGSVVNGSMVQDCAALNSLVSGTSQVGRVVGFNNGGTLSGNIAFAGMDVLLGGSPKTPASDTEGIDGLTITAAEIKSDGTIGGLFTSTGGWSTQNGKLPGLFSNTVEMSAYTEDETDPYFAGEGTAASPFLIATAEQLAKLAELVNAGDSKYNSAHYEMIADIDLSIYDDSNTSFNGGKGWIPIGGQFSSFYGTFDGGQNIVTGLYINNTSLSNTGLFGFIYEGNVRNIGLVDVRVNGNSSVGGVAGYVGNGGVRNCYVTGSVSGSSFDVGGVVGYLNKGTVQNCYVTADVSGGDNAWSGVSYTGGIIGRVTNGSTVQGCYSTGSVEGSKLNVGGIAGYFDNKSKVEDCAALNYKVSGSGNFARVVGNSSGSLSNNVGFVGILDKSGNPLYEGNDPDGRDGTGISAEDLQLYTNLPAAFYDGDNNPWSCADGSLPGLFGKTVPMPAHITNKLTNYFIGSGSQEAPYIIVNAAQLANLAELVNAGTSPYADENIYYRLENDIDLSDYGKSFRDGKGWMPFGNDLKPFKGSFDGNSKTISGLYINDDTLSCAGLFGYINGGSVQNLGLADVNINGSDNVGSLAGNLGGTAQYCYAIGDVNGNNYVGGLVGLNSGTVQYCYVSGNVKGNNEYVGGLVGYLDSGAKTENSCTTGTVSGCDWVGGVAGYVTGILQYCYSVAVVNGSTLVGGIAGYVESSGKVEKCIAINPSAGNNGVSTIGRIVGENVGSLVSNYSFSGMKVNGQTISSGVSGDINGEDISIGQIYDMAFWKDSAGWSDSIWCFQNGELPVLVNLSGQFKRNIAGAAVEVTGDLTYTGSRVEPTVEVIFVGIPLIEGIDYDGVTFSNNTNTGTAKVEVTGKGNFTGTISKEFTIAKADPPADVQRTIEVSEKYQHNYEVKLTELLPGVTGTLGTVEFYPAIDENNEGLLGTLNYSSGDTLILPVNAVSGVGKTAKVKVKVESTNYDDFNIVLTVKTIAKQEVNISSEEDDSSGGRIIASPKTPKTIINISGNVVVTEATAEATIDSRGKATAAFSQAQVNDAIDKAMKEAEKLGEGTKSNVVLKVEAPANVTTVQTSIPKEAVIKASKSGISSLTISTPIGDITFDSNALSTISKEAAGDIKSTISRVETSSLSPEAQRIIGGRPVFDITVTCGDKEISRFEGEVTVSVPYTPKEGEDINAIVIYHINASGELEAVSNCVYDPATGMVTFSTGHLSMYGVSYNKIRFKDVAESAWYSKAVTFISAREIATGTGGGNFSPEAKLTRGQFMVMLMKACGIAPDPDAKDNFADAGNTYYTGYLAAAKRLDISKGVGNNMFEPEKYITNQEMVTMLYNGLKTTGRLPEVTAGKPLSGFADAGSIAPWAYEAMKAMAESGIIGGNGGKLNPTGTTTRGEMAQVLYDLLSNR